MIIPARGVDGIVGAQVNKLYPTQSSAAVQKTMRSDSVSISSFSTAVERGRSAALSLPDVRADRVAQARSALASGELASPVDIASMMINRAVQGDV